MKKVFKILMLVGLTSMTIACSTTNNKKSSDYANSSNYSGAGQNGTSSMGLGEDANVNGENIGGYCISDACRLKAPNNQIYFFDYDNSQLHDKYSASVNAQANYVVAHSSAKLLLTGNTDERGSREYNIALGNRRAIAVANALKNQGVKSSQVRVLSYGSEKPIASGHDEHSWSVNRNVQLIYEGK